MLGECLNLAVCIIVLQKWGKGKSFHFNHFVLPETKILRYMQRDFIVIDYGYF